MKRFECIRLYPTPRQEGTLRFALDVTRELYNALLQERRDAYRLRGVSVTKKQQYREITALRRPAQCIDGRLGAVYRECEDAVLHRLELAFAAFYRRCRRREIPGFPRFKSAARWNMLEFPHGERALRFDAQQHRVKVPGIGAVKLRKGRFVPPFGRARIVTRNGRWYASFECERAACPLPKTGSIVGIDRGVHVLAALSDGTLLPNRSALERRKAAATRLQRELEALTERDGAGRVRNRRDHARIGAVMRLARSREREANARRDHAHKIARRIVSHADIIAIEKLRVRSMTRSAKGTSARPGSKVAAKSALNRRVLDAGFGLLRRMIVAKAEEAARTVVEVEPRFTSLECSRCGHIARENRRRRRFRCVACDYASHADVNAALVIRRRAQLALMSEPEPAEDAGRRIRYAAQAHTTNHLAQSHESVI